VVATPLVVATNGMLGPDDPYMKMTGMEEVEIRRIVEGGVAIPRQVLPPRRSLLLLGANIHMLQRPRRSLHQKVTVVAGMLMAGMMMDMVGIMMDTVHITRTMIVKKVGLLSERRFLLLLLLVLPALRRRMYVNDGLV
jgi:hypothetical protein